MGLPRIGNVCGKLQEYNLNFPFFAAARSSV